MADLKSSIRTYLVGLTSVTDELSTRIYNLWAPQSPTYPYAVLEVISTDSDLSGVGESGLFRSTFDVTIHSDASIGGSDAGDAVRLVLDGLSETALSGITFDRVEMTDERDQVTAPTDADPNPKAVKVLTFESWYHLTKSTFPAS